MNAERDAEADGLDSRTRGALGALRVLIHSRFPTATFRVTRGYDNSDAVHLLAFDDLDDLDEMLDLVSDDLSRLEDEEGILVHVIPLHTPERVLADMRARDAATRQSPIMSPPAKPERAR